MRRFLCLTLLLICPVFMAAGQTAPLRTAEQSDEKAKHLCKVEGRVTSLVTGEPVRKVNVALHPEDPSGTVLTAATDGEGKFAVEKVDPGRYTLSAERQGFVKANYGARNAQGPGTMLQLKDAQTLSGLEFKLTPQGVIAGKVLDEEGEKMTGLSVQALQYRYISGRKHLVPAAAPVPTNDLGEYRIPNLSPGRYYIGTTSQSLMNIQMGTERAATKGPEEGNVPTYFPNSTDVAGASPIELKAGGEQSAVDIRLRKAQVFRVSGTLMNSATGSPGTGVVMVYRREAGGITTLPVSMYIVQGNKGSFELRNIPAGPYSILAVSGNPPDMMMSMTSMDVGERNLEGLSVGLGAGAEIAVTAKIVDTPQSGSDKSATSPEDPKKDSRPSRDLGNTRVMLRVDDNPMNSLVNAQLDKDQKAVLKRVNPDKYSLVVMGLPDGTYLKAAKFGVQDVLESGLDVRAGGGGTLELTVAAPAGELTGVVQNAKGEPAPGAIVTLVPKDAKHRTDLYRTGTTDQNGNLRIRGIVPAEYKVFAWEDIESGAVEEAEFRKPFETKGVGVKLSEGAPGSVQLTLISKAMVEEEQAKK